MSSERKSDSGDLQTILDGFDVLLGEAAKRPQHVAEARMSGAYARLVHSEIEPADYARSLRAMSRWRGRASHQSDIDARTRAARQRELSSREAELREIYARAEHRLAHASLRYRFSMFRLSSEFVVGATALMLLAVVVVPRSWRLAQSVSSVVVLSYVAAATVVALVVSLAVARALVLFDDRRALRSSLFGTRSECECSATKSRSLVASRHNDRQYRHRYRVAVVTAVFCLVIVASMTVVTTVSLVSHLNRNLPAATHSRSSRTIDIDSPAATLAPRVRGSSDSLVRHSEGKPALRKVAAPPSLSSASEASSETAQRTSDPRGKASETRSAHSSASTGVSTNQTVTRSSGGVAVSGASNSTETTQSGSTSTTPTSAPASSGIPTTGGTAPGVSP